MTILGLSFKPNTDDIRESTSIKLAVLLKSKGYQINVFDQHKALKVKPLPKIQDLLEIPTNKDNLPSDVIEKEIENCAQGILGYVVRWIDQGIGCSKVPDINDIGLMEDRATCRISSQLLANWLHHKLCSEDHIISAFKKMAVKVD